MTLIELAPLLTLRDAFLGVASALCLLIVFILGWARGARKWERAFWREVVRHSPKRDARGRFQRSSK